MSVQSDNLKAPKNGALSSSAKIGLRNSCPPLAGRRLSHLAAEVAAALGLRSAVVLSTWRILAARSVFVNGFWRKAPWSRMPRSAIVWLV